VLHIAKVYKIVYVVGNKLSKRDKLGIHTVIEEVILKTVTLSIKATFIERAKKSLYLEEVRVNIESTKILIRTEHELGIIPEKTYFILSHHLIEASKMTNGWIKSLKTNTPR
jgi:hypothetical protein